jgi:hypothetical protein
MVLSAKVRKNSSQNERLWHTDIRNSSSQLLASKIQYKEQNYKKIAILLISIFMHREEFAPSSTSPDLAQHFLSDWL